MEQEIRKLIDTYEQLLHDHKIPIDMTTKEQCHLDGYDSALRKVIYELKDILYHKNNESINKEMYSYTE